MCIRDRFRRMVWPSSMGLMPTSLAMMALLMARSRVRSQGCLLYTSQFLSGRSKPSSTLPSVMNSLYLHLGQR